MSVCVYSASVVSCVQVAGLRRADPQFKESYRLCIDEGAEKAAKAHKGFRVIEKKKGLKFAYAFDS
jgi:hypothetical protein